ncbi:MFS transporter [Actinospica robiniae]|uniref:MFS transporter n=1 Tax=Actinospica robiniae TaxID=304901 RepID=UPI00054D041C|nr:MFS transporter [Actinospica robiniae]
MKNRPASTFAPLRTRDFRVLWAGQSVSLFGDRVFPIALATLLLTSGRGASGLGLVLAARSVALVAVVLPAGVLADRVRRTHVMFAANLLCLGGVAGLALGRYPVSVGLACVCGAAVGAGEGIFTPAFSAVVPQVLPDEDMQSGNALMSLSSQTAMIAGPALGGLLVALGSLRSAFLIDGATFVVSCACLAAIRVERPEPTGEGMSLRVAAGGFAEVAKRPWVSAVMLMSCVQMVFASATWTLLLPVIARTRLDGTPAYSALLVTFGAGALLGALAASRWRPSRPGAAALAALLPFGAMLAVMAVSRSVFVIGAATALAGAGLEFFGIAWMTALQRGIPERALARVMSLDYFVSGLLYPIGLAAMGPLASHFGAGAILVLGAAVLAASTLGPMFVPGGLDFADPGPAPGPVDRASVVGSSADG